MDEPFGTRPFPRGALLGAAALLAVALLGVVSGRWLGIGVVQTPAAPAAVSRDLRFEDRADGAVVVRDAADGAVVAVFGAGEGGFVRGVLRGLARERRSHHVGPEPPFRLLRSDSGQLFLEDPQTGRRIGLDAFGPANAGAFARLLEAGPQAVTGEPNPISAQGG